ncbi:MAG: hydantoinase/oxoprolinase family protein [Beijerinckiaceae bacterium]|jgi:N-methylhydantoinase A|nr:hydantoinase/oxoprolinase family protein [Beijerinckiaceae bacterium]
MREVVDGSPGDEVRIAVDIGGTFTDLALMTGDGRLHQGKVSTTPDDPSRAVVAGIAELLSRLNLPPSSVKEVLHGTTVGSNAILQRKGSRTGLITTDGFRDILEIGRIRMPVMFDLTWAKPAPLVPRRLRLGVPERIAADGSVVTPLDEEAVAAAVQELIRQDVEAIAICFLNSYRNSAHERRAEAIVREVAPGLAVCASCSVLPEMKEYERTSTTVVNAYLLRTMQDYLTRLENSLTEIGLRAPVLVMTSNGAMLPARIAADLPVFVVGSGPAGGVIGGARLGAARGDRDLIVFDMGGTTAKAALVEGGEPIMTTEYEFRDGISTSSRFIKAGGYMLKVPAIDLAEVGAGGGSLAMIDPGGLLRVGPESAGADPGPACYRNGNERPTVTDANVALGFLNPEALAGGQLPIDRDASIDAINTHAARPLGIDVAAAAHGIREVANALMARAIRSVTVERGRDPRDLSLVAMGGNGGVHAVDIARQLGIPRVLVPTLSGVFSAVGMMASDVEHMFLRTILLPLDAFDPVEFAHWIAELDAAAAARLAGDGYPPERQDRIWTAELRYEGQASELPVRFVPALVTATTLAADFAAAYRELYGYADESKVELVKLRLAARGLRDRRLDFAAVKVEQRPSAAHGETRMVSFGRGEETRPTPVITRSSLSMVPRSGPLIIEEFDATIIVPPGAAVARDELGTIIIDVDQDAATPATKREG